MDLAFCFRAASTRFVWNAVVLNDFTRLPATTISSLFDGEVLSLPDKGSVLEQWRGRR